MMQTNTPRQAQKQKSFSDPKVHQPPQPPRNNDAEKRSTRNLPENRQTRTEEILVKLTEGLTNLPSKVCDEFMERCVESEKQLVTKSKEAEELRSEVQSLKEQLQQQKADSQDKVEQLETKSTEAKGLRSELQSLKEQLQHQKADNQEKVAELITTIQGLDEDKRKLREVILGNALRHEVSDDEIRQRFVNIRQQIQAVVNNPALNKTRKFMPSAAGNSPMFRLYREYNSYSPEDRVFLMRSAVYQIICHFILGRDAFGLAEPVLPPQYNREAQLDQFLGDFEGFSERNLLEIAAEINRLCDDAFALRLLTRKSGDRYHFDGPTRGVECVPAKGNVEICAVLGGGEVSKYVAFSICGALIKKTGNEESEVTCVLEPAHVVVQAKESGKSPHLTRDFGQSDVR
ncbi:hypothetical protein E4U39_006453 [Claviceps sp. Clav50 group G5]|nr:hypothetical protein E4U39_006453 [Claviceps sp. Clav50 group G5]